MSPSAMIIKARHISSAFFPKCDGAFKYPLWLAIQDSIQSEFRVKLISFPKTAARCTRYTPPFSRKIDALAPCVEHVVPECTSVKHVDSKANLNKRV